MNEITRRRTRTFIVATVAAAGLTLLTGNVPLTPSQMAIAALITFLAGVVIGAIRIKIRRKTDGNR